MAKTAISKERKKTNPVRAYNNLSLFDKIRIKRF